MKRKTKRPIPKYVELAMLRLMDCPDLVRLVGKTMPHAAREVGVRLFNISRENETEFIRKLNQREIDPQRKTKGRT